MANRNNDLIPSTEQWKKRARDILASLEKEEAPSRPVPRIERVDHNARMEPIVMPEKNVLTDPQSWLNRGLMTLGGNAVDAVFGRESGNDLVDYGVSNVPGVGAASILAAGGMPGIVDATGLGALKHGKKIVKSVREFILRNAGEPGLKAVDNYLDKFPKVDKLSMADADYLLTSGKLGEKYKVDYPNVDKLVSGPKEMLESIKSEEDKILGEFGHYDEKDPTRLLWIDEPGLTSIVNLRPAKELLEEAIKVANKGDMAESSLLFGASTGILSSLRNPEEFEVIAKMGPKAVKEHAIEFVKKKRAYDLATGRNDYDDPSIGEYIMNQLSPMQDFNKIEANQLAKDAKRAAKKGGTVVEAPSEPGGSIVTVEPEPAGTVVEIPPEPEPVRGGPNKWRENGWKSEEHPLSNGLTYEDLVGRNATEDDRRASFVLDSLMNDAVGRLYSTGAKWGESGKFYKKGNIPASDKAVTPSYADYRHKGTNYDAVRLKLARDLQENAVTGNMPTTARAVLEQAYNTRTGNRIPGAKVLRLNGVDTYEALFRPRVKDRLRELEEYYNIDFMR